MTIQTMVATSQNKTFRHYDNVAAMKTPVVTAFTKQIVSQTSKRSNPGVTHSHTKLIRSIYDYQVMV
jgi:hypothetical protein